MTRVLNKDVRIQQLNISFGAVNQTLFGTGRVIIIWLAALQVLENKFSTGMLVAFVAFADQFFARCIALVDKWVDFKMLKLHVDRLSDIARAIPETEDV